MHIGFHDKNENNPGALLTRLSYDAANVNNIVLSAFGVLVQAVIILFLASAIGFYYNWRLSLINLAILPLIFFSSYYYYKVTSDDEEGNIESECLAGELLSECVCNTKTVFAYNFQKKAVKIFEEILQEPYKDLVKDSLIKGIFFGVSQGIIYLPCAIIFYMGSRFIANKSATYGDIIKAYFTMASAVFDFGMTQIYIRNIQKAEESLKNLMKIQDKHSHQDPFRPKANSLYPEKILGKIEFKNVSFCYPKRKKLVLKNVSFVIQPGQIAAFVGPSGSGKSTIVQLLERFYDIPKKNAVCSGLILLDDEDIRQIDPQCLRNFISFVGQEPVIFKRSVRENIRYGKLDALESQIDKAAESAKIRHLLKQKSVAGLPVSGGEKQRIAIARAIIRDPKILMLDEATSALDKNTEMEIQKSLEKIMMNRTSIVIAHR